MPKTPPRTGRFMRPVDGKIISGYGPKEGGLHNDGINIKAAKGTAVRAAENGVVAYTGNEMAGYGNLILIRHADRWMTAYAHMDKILVKKGDVVSAGQTVGTVGATGQVDSPQLHFEVRKGTQAEDPAKYL
jgi:murein DD-endopeptidase MepM/ murein hydrolase activator NlpD